MNIISLLSILTFFTASSATNANHSFEESSNNWISRPNKDSYEYPNILKTSQQIENPWYEDVSYKYETAEVEEVTTDRYHVPAVMEGGLLRAQIPQHTLIAIDRFLKILKSLAGFAILIAIGMPFIHEITTSIFEETIKYLI